MDLAMIGLGKMGANMVTRLLQGKHRIVAFDLNADAVRAAEAEGAEGAYQLEAIVTKLKSPRAVWIMVPSGDPTEKTIQTLSNLLQPGDIVIDGGNSNYKDSMRRGQFLAEKNIHFVDVGTSGGIWGLKEGYSMMIGGDKQVVESLRPIFETLAPAADRGWGHVGPSGSGHFVKMIHNGIEYGLMQAYAEGFAIMERKTEFGLDLGQIAHIWQNGSVVRSWLLDLAVPILQQSPQLEGIEPFVPDSGEGRWTVMEAIDLNVPAPIITLSLENRIHSREKNSYGDKLLAMLRNAFGGHAVFKDKE